MRGVPVGVTFVTSLPAVGIMECYAFQALDGSFWHALDSREGRVRATG